LSERFTVIGIILNQ